MITERVLEKLLDRTRRVTMLEIDDLWLREGFIDKKATVKYPVLIKGVSLNKFTDTEVMGGVEVLAEVKGLGYIPLQPKIVKPDYPIYCSKGFWVLHILAFVHSGNLLSSYIKEVEI